MGLRQPHYVWVNGQILPADQPHISSFDRGIQLGDGIFETVRAHAGNPTDLKAHIARLRRSAAGLDFDLPVDVVDVVTTGITDLLAAEKLDGAHDDASIRIIVTRGMWYNRDVLPSLGDPVPPTIVIQAWKVAPVGPVDPQSGLSVIHSEVRHDPRSPLLGLKTLSRVDYVYARLEARAAEVDDVLFLTTDDYVSEATNANVFCIRQADDGVTELATPSLDCAALPGTTRSWLLSWASEVSLRPFQGKLTLDDLIGASEVFLSSSVAGIRPVVRVDGCLIGTGHPGPWTVRARADREAYLTGEQS